ncbi:hypothetical protein [Tsukamurella pseudospumae]|uniref:Uncharacterized protein n=1 Tax=Tsukamurella pseudospumae TaxID=239498 RepID=A0A137ZRP8_9ACTN|nr:hypothetical protein [Tsukamurella pseudospumae]KXP00858.1 hypothetical protein AXK61_12680 [Tsukamurella pseudospumae]
MIILAPTSPAFGLTADELTERHAELPLVDQVQRQRELNAADGIADLVLPPAALDRLAALRVGEAAA